MPQKVYFSWVIRVYVGLIMLVTCFYGAKSVFLVVNTSLRWLNNVSDVYVVQVSWFLIGQQGLRHFVRYLPLLPFGWRIVQCTNFTPTP
jgi:hypothetical protein